MRGQRNSVRDVNVGVISGIQRAVQIVGVVGGTNGVLLNSARESRVKISQNLQ